MAGPYLQLGMKLGPAIGGAWETTVGWPWSVLAPKNTPMAGEKASPLAGI